MAYNVDFDKINITVVQNDTWSMTFSVKLNNVLYDMTGQQLDIEVKDEDGVDVLAISSAGVNPAITINTTSFSIYQELAFPAVGKYFYDVQLTDPSTGAKVSTICRGYIKVIAEYTD